MITPEQALAIYHAGPEAVVKVVCELSRQVDLLQKRVEELANFVERVQVFRCSVFRTENALAFSEL